MTARLRITLVCTLLVGSLSVGLSWADKPKAATKPAVATKKTQVELKEAKPQQAVVAQGPAAAIDVGELAAPFVEALAEKLDLTAVDAQVQQWIPQFTQQYRPFLTTELNFIRQMCDLKPEQRPKVKAAGEAAVTQVVRLMAEQQGRAMRGVNFVERNNAVPPEPSRFILDALVKALKETLTEEQLTKYTDESAKRTAMRKRAAMQCAVALLDAKLCLTVEQRDQITESVSAKWQTEWESWLMLPQYGGQYFPTIPDNLIVPHLNVEQKSVWNGFQKVSFGHWGGDGQEQQQDGWWGDEPAKGAEPVRVNAVFDIDLK